MRTYYVKGDDDLVKAQMPYYRALPERKMLDFQIHKQNGGRMASTCSATLTGGWDHNKLISDNSDTFELLNKREAMLLFKSGIKLTLKQNTDLPQF